MKCLIVFFPWLLFAQQKITPQYIDSEYNKLDILYSEAKIHEGLKKNIFLLEESKKIHYSKGIARGYLRLSYYYSNSRNYKKGLEYLKLAEEENENSKNDLKLQSEIKRELGFNYYNIGLYQKAIDEFKENVKLSESISDYSSKIKVKSIAYFEIGATYKKINQLDSCKWYIKKGIDLLKNEKKLDRILQMYLVYNNLILAEYDVSEKKINSSEIYVKSLDASSKEILGNNNFQLYKVKGMINEYRKEYDSAIFNFQKAISLTKNTGNVERLQGLYSDISRIYQQSGDNSSSQKYLQKYISIKDSLANAKQPAIENTVRELVVQKEKEIKSKNKFLIYIIWIGSFSVIIFILIIIKRERKKNKILSVKEQETQLLNQKLNIAFDQVIQLAKKNDPEFMTRFQEVYPNFFPRLLQIEPQLQNSELKFCALLFLNFSSKDIAAYTFVQPRSIQIRKNRLRKRLNISSEEDLYIWMKNINNN
jgi:tetratricopeptide (TPR) repeat protein